MILFKPRLDVDFQKLNADNFGRCILAETIIDGTKVVLVNIYAPNDKNPTSGFPQGRFKRISNPLRQ